jgi:hypothetical protein
LITVSPCSYRSQYPDIIGKDEIAKYDIQEYAQAYFNFERKKRTIRTLGRKKGDLSMSDVLCYSKVRH